MSGAPLGGVKPRLLLKGLVMIASLAAVGYGLKISGLGGILTQGWVDSQIKGHGLAGILLFVGLGSGLIAIGVPRQAVSFLGGYAFGLLQGLALASAATLLGCMLCFFYARLLGRELVLHQFAGKVRRIDDFLKDNPLSMAVLIRFLPVGSNLFTNLMAGVSSVPPLPFFAGSLLGYLPQTLVFVLLGTGVQVDPLLRIGASVALFLVSAVMGVVLYRRLRHGHSLDGALDAEIGE